MKKFINKKQIRNRMFELYLSVSSYERSHILNSAVNYSYAYASISRILLLLSNCSLSLSDRVEISVSVSLLESYLRECDVL